MQGRKSRYRTADDVERLVRMNWAQGISKFFITDDNFARNSEWEAIFDRLIKLREVDGIPLGLMIQVDTLCHKLPNFVEKAKRAGVTRVFIGLENINPDNLVAAKKKQNKITEYRKMLLAWKAQGILTLPATSSAFPPTRRPRSSATSRSSSASCRSTSSNSSVSRRCPARRTTRNSGARAPRWIPTSTSTTSSTSAPTRKMSKAEWERAYHEAWGHYYTPEHMDVAQARGCDRPADRQPGKAARSLLHLGPR